MTSWMSAGSDVIAREGTFERAPGLGLYRCDFLPRRLEASAVGTAQASAEPGGDGAAAPGGALLVLMHGYAEHCRRYDELAFSLARRGHVVSAFDARGHGRSPGQRGHIRSYEESVDDFVAFTADVRARYPQRPLLALGHSNGGLIALRAVQGGLALRGLALTSPLLRLRERRKPVPDALASVLSRALPWLPLPNGLDARDLTHDLALQAAHSRDRWSHRVATPRWYWASTLAGRDALADAPRLTLPLLIVQGELDPIVDPASVAELHARATSTDKRLVMRAGELHEVLNELGRLELYALIAEWMERLATAEPVCSGAVLPGERPSTERTHPAQG
jgi:alpha-beta hydrolase superfamily lysophospholipase